MKLDETQPQQPNVQPAPWNALEAIPGLTAVACDWQEQTGPQFQPFYALCLQATDWLAESYTCPRHCGCVHRVIIRHDRSSAVAACQCEPPQCPDIPLTIEDITPLEVSWVHLSRALAAAFHLTPKFAKLGPPRTVQFAAIGPDLVPAILTIHSLPSSFRTAVADLVASLRNRFALFAPTASMFDATYQNLLANFGAVFHSLDATTALAPNGTLVSTRPPSELFAPFLPKAPSSRTAPPPRYLIRKGLGMWKLIFDGQETYLKHERGIFYIASLLTGPPGEPIHAIDLMAKIPEIYRQQLGLAPLVDPATGKTTVLQSHARIQERSLALDDAQTMRALLRKERELEAILDSEDATEPEKAEALRELEAIAQFQRQHASRSKDAAQAQVRTVRKAIYRLYKRLLLAHDAQGNPHKLLRSFALHISTHILLPSSRFASLQSRAKAHSPASFTYDPPSGLRWSQ